MLILGLETSCDETAAAVVADGRRVLSNVVASQYELHEEYAGVVPEIASRAHVEKILPVIRESLAQAGIGLGMIDAIAVGNRPGLIGSLLVGVAAAKSIAWSLGKPLVGVDHVHAHLYSGVLIDEGSDVSTSRAIVASTFPALGLVVSGGHTSLYRLDSWIRITRLGATIDDALGEAFDKAAIILGLPHPGGPNLDKLADSAGVNDRLVQFPLSRLSPSSLDFSFSGLKTALLYEANGVPGPKGKPAPAMTAARKADLAACFRRAAVDTILLKMKRALATVPAADKSVRRTVFCGGGVTANRLLRQELQALARGPDDLHLHLPPMRFCTDNAAMIAGLAHELLSAGIVSDMTLQATPTTSL